MKKGFPKLQRQMTGNKDDLVSAPVEDLQILSAEEEAQIAIADICSKRPANAVKTVVEAEERKVEDEEKRGDEGIKPPLVDGDENEEIRRQNALMFQYILSQQTK